MEEAIGWLREASFAQAGVFFAGAALMAVVVSLTVHWRLGLSRFPVLAVQISTVATLLAYPGLYSYICVLYRVTELSEGDPFAPLSYGVLTALTVIVTGPICVVFSLVFGASHRAKVPTGARAVSSHQRAFRVSAWVVSIVMAVIWSFVAAFGISADSKPEEVMMRLLLSNFYGLLSAAVAGALLLMLRAFGFGVEPLASEAATDDG